MIAASAARAQFGAGPGEDLQSVYTGDPGQAAEPTGPNPAAIAPGEPGPAGPSPVHVPALIVELTDTALIASAWRTFFPDSTVPFGEYQILIPSGPNLSSGRELSSTIYLLRNGTEVGHMERAFWENLVAASDQEIGLAAAMEGPEKQDVPLLWNAFEWTPETLLRWAEWPAGFAFGMGTAVSSIQSSKPQFHRDIDFAWDQKLFDHFLLGGELHRSQFGGGLTRLGETVADTADWGLPGKDDPDFWSDSFWWWSLSAGVPGLKYTMSLANQPLPRFYWLETRATAAIRAQRPGRLVNQWTGDKLELDGNLAHTLDARLGAIRYQFHWDMDAYSMPVQTIGLNELPAWFGTWGTGFVIASDLIATRLWVDIPDLALNLGVPRGYPTRFRVAFLHVDMAYRNLRNFNLGISLRVRIDNPIMNRPGA